MPQNVFTRRITNMATVLNFVVSETLKSTLLTSKHIETLESSATRLLKPQILQVTCKFSVHFFLTEI
jgi:hypothetical protein